MMNISESQAEQYKEQYSAVEIEDFQGNKFLLLAGAIMQIVPDSVVQEIKAEAQKQKEDAEQQPEQ